MRVSSSVCHLHLHGRPDSRSHSSLHIHFRTRHYHILHHHCIHLASHSCYAAAVEAVAAYTDRTALEGSPVAAWVVDILVEVAVVDTPDQLAARNRVELPEPQDEVADWRTRLVPCWSMHRLYRSRHSRHSRFHIPHFCRCCRIAGRLEPRS